MNMKFISYVFYVNNKGLLTLEKLKEKKMGYLKCKSCGGRYDLEPGESPDDFVRCQCGGELEFYDDQGTKREYGSVSGKKVLKCILL